MVVSCVLNRKVRNGMLPYCDGKYNYRSAPVACGNLPVGKPPIPNIFA